MSEVDDPTYKYMASSCFIIVLIVLNTGSRRLFDLPI